MLLQWTRHARERARERGIPSRVVRAAIRFGRQWPTGDARRYVIDRRAIRRARYQSIPVDRFLGATVIVGGDQRVRTVFWDSTLGGR